MNGRVDKANVFDAEGVEFKPRNVKKLSSQWLFHYEKFRYRFVSNSPWKFCRKTFKTADERHKMFWTEQWRKRCRNGRENVSKIKEPLYFTVLLSQVWNQHQDELVRLIARLTDKLGVVSSLLTAAKGERKPWNDPYSCIQEVLKLCFK